jgi:hypothetical protein
LFRAFRIFNPSYAKTLSREDAAFALIEKLDHYPIFRRGGYVAKLKRGWNAYRQNASLVVADFGRSNDGKKDSSAILTWHYRMFLHTVKDEADDNHCRYCPRNTRGYACYDDLKTWWDVTKETSFRVGTDSVLLWNLGTLVRLLRYDWKDENTRKRLKCVRAPDGRVRRENDGR